MSQPTAEQQSAGEAGELFHKHYRRLRQYILSRVPDRSDAEDLVQEVFAEYLQAARAGAFELVRDPLKYVYGIAAHVVSDHRKRAATWRPRVVPLDADVMSHAMEETSQESPDQVAERLSNGRALKQAIDAVLPATHRRVLLLVYGQGLSHAGAADQLDLSEHTVKKYVCEGLAKLRVHWKRQAEQ